MLSSLYIENIAVIEKASIDFDSGFTVLTGETGAGKSIIIDSINAVLGQRMPKDLIRAGEDHAKVDALFTELSDETKAKLQEHGFDVEDELLISREVKDGGKSSVKLNGRPTTNAILRDITSTLIDIYGQSDARFVANPDQHRIFLDNYAKNETLLLQYSEIYKRYKEIGAQIFELQSADRDKSDLSDLISFQIDEIEAAELVSGEEEELLNFKEVFKNSEKILKDLNETLAMLKGDIDTNGAQDLISASAQNIERTSQYLPEFVEMSTKINDISYELCEIANVIESTVENFDFDKQRQEEVMNRLDTIYRLRKYGNTTDEILEFLDDAKLKLSRINRSSEIAQELEIELKKHFENLRIVSDKISKVRSLYIDQLKDDIKAELISLDMPAVSFEISRESCEFRRDGAEKIEFLISVNAGEELKPISKVASGGELSRIVLAMKMIEKNDEPGLSMIFDEIDTGVSGRASAKIATKLRSIAKGRQVICVTHSAVIAAYANNQLLIEKNEQNGKTYTTIRKVSGDERLREIARITIGDKITQASIDTASEMVKQAELI